MLLLAGCAQDGVSAAEARRIAEERVRQELGLTPEGAVFSNVFVGREGEDRDHPVICGTVGGTRHDGTRIGPRRFIMSMDEARTLAWERLGAATAVTPTDKFPEWAELCAGARGETGAEPLAPTERGER